MDLEEFLHTALLYQATNTINLACFSFALLCDKMAANLRHMIIFIVPHPVIKPVYKVCNEKIGLPPKLVPLANFGPVKKKIVPPRIFILA